MMNKIVVKCFLGVILSLSLFSCGLMGIRDLNKQMDFFESQEHDSRLYGSWKQVPTYNREVTVLEFSSNGFCKTSRAGDAYRRYYTKTRERKIYILRTKKHTSHPIVDTADYKFDGDTLILTFESGSKSTYVKLWDDESLVD